MPKIDKMRKKIRLDIFNKIQSYIKNKDLNNLQIYLTTISSNKIEKNYNSKKKLYRGMRYKPSQLEKRSERLPFLKRFKIKF